MSSFRQQEEPETATEEVAVEEVDSVSEKQVGPRKRPVVDVQTSMRYLQSKGGLFKHSIGGAIAHRELR